mgnify:CR=1 FL=1
MVSVGSQQGTRRDALARSMTCQTRNSDLSWAWYERLSSNLEDSLALQNPLIPRPPPLKFQVSTSSASFTLLSSADKLRDPSEVAKLWKPWPISRLELAFGKPLGQGMEPLRSDHFLLALLAVSLRHTTFYFFFGQGESRIVGAGTAALFHLDSKGGRSLLSLHQFFLSAMQILSLKFNLGSSPNRTLAKKQSKRSIPSNRAGWLWVAGKPCRCSQ